MNRSGRTAPARTRIDCRGPPENAGHRLSHCVQEHKDQCVTLLLCMPAQIEFDPNPCRKQAKRQRRSNGSEWPSPKAACSVPTLQMSGTMSPKSLQGGAWT